MSEDRKHGTDTPTGTDPDAKWSEPGYEDKSLGQAVDQDSELAEQLLDEEGGDEAAAEIQQRHEGHEVFGEGAGSSLVNEAYSALKASFKFASLNSFRPPLLPGPRV